MVIDRREVSAAAFEQATGWQIKPKGACYGEMCVPLGGGAFDPGVAAERLGMAVVDDDASGLRAFGPATLGGRALTTTDTGDVTLPDLDGNAFSFSSLRGQKVLAVAWAPY